MGFELDFDDHNKKLWRHVGLCLTFFSLLFLDFAGEVATAIWFEMVLNVGLFAAAVMNIGMGATRFVAFRFCPSDDNDTGEDDPPHPRQPQREPTRQSQQPQREAPAPVRVNSQSNGRPVTRLMLDQEFKDKIVFKLIDGGLRRVTLAALERAGINRTNMKHRDYGSDAHLVIAILKQWGHIDRDGNWTDSGLAEFSPPHSQELAYAY